MHMMLLKILFRH